MTNDLFNRITKIPLTIEEQENFTVVEFQQAIEHFKEILYNDEPSLQLQPDSFTFGSSRNLRFNVIRSSDYVRYAETLLCNFIGNRVNLFPDMSISSMRDMIAYYHDEYRRTNLNYDEVLSYLYIIENMLDRLEYTRKYVT